jgi:hypothetical protein
MICQQLELLFPHYGISCCAEITAVVPRKARKRGPKPDSRGMNKNHLHPRQPTQRYGLCRGRERSYSPCFAWLPSLNSVQDYGIHSLVFVEFHEARLSRDHDRRDLSREARLQVASGLKTGIDRFRPAFPG